MAAPKSTYRVPYNGKFKVPGARTSPPKNRGDKTKEKKRLKKLQEEMRELQRRLYAADRHSLLLVFQAMDAAGKDGTIRAVMSGVNPAGCQVSAFKAPSSQELDHDFLWRIYRSLPERGRIGIFNRSHYEEALVVKVHPEYLAGQRLPHAENALATKSFWNERYESIRNFEQHLARNGTVILKFWLNVSKDEQRDRFLDRIDEPEANWKFSTGDVRERGHWDSYMDAYEDVLNATSRPWAPWYAIPADNKPYMRAEVASIIVNALKDLDPQYPEVSAKARREMKKLRGELAKS